MELFALVIWINTWSQPHQSWITHHQKTVTFTKTFKECNDKGIKREEEYLKYFDGYYQCVPVKEVTGWPVKLDNEREYSVY